MIARRRVSVTTLAGSGSEHSSVGGGGGRGNSKLPLLVGVDLGADAQLDAAFTADSVGHPIGLGPTLSQHQRTPIALPVGVSVLPPIPEDLPPSAAGLRGTLAGGSLADNMVVDDTSGISAAVNARRSSGDGSTPDNDSDAEMELGLDARLPLPAGIDAAGGSATGISQAPTPTHGGAPASAGGATMSVPRNEATAAALRDLEWSRRQAAAAIVVRRSMLRFYEQAAASSSASGAPPVSK